MTTATVPPTGARVTRDPIASVRRVLGLARYEVLLLIRNKVMLINALVITPLMVAAFLSFLGVNLIPADVVMLTSTWGLMFVVYLNLTAIFVSRRDDRVFARMETGEASKWEGLVAAAVPSSVVMLLQLVIAGVVGMIAFDGPLFAEPVQAVIGLILAIGIFAGLAAATTAFTKTVEAAQITTMPILIGMILFSGVTFPAQLLPEIVQRIAAATPLNALLALVVPGAPVAGLPAPPLAILALWAVAALLLARRYTAFAARR